MSHETPPEHQLSQALKNLAEGLEDFQIAFSDTNPEWPYRAQAVLRGARSQFFRDVEPVIHAARNQDVSDEVREWLFTLSKELICLGDPSFMDFPVKSFHGETKYEPTDDIMAELPLNPAPLDCFIQEVEQAPDIWQKQDGDLPEQIEGAKAGVLRVASDFAREAEALARQVIPLDNEPIAGEPLCKLTIKGLAEWVSRGEDTIRRACDNAEPPVERASRGEHGKEFTPREVDRIARARAEMGNGLKEDEKHRWNKLLQQLGQRTLDQPRRAQPRSG